MGHLIDGDAVGATRRPVPPAPPFQSASASLPLSSRPAGVPAAIPAPLTPLGRPMDGRQEALTIHTAATPTILWRDRRPWTQGDVDALINAGVIQASWLPDIRAVAPEKLMIQREHQRDMLRFSNAIANTGANNWQVRRGSPLNASTDPDGRRLAYASSLGLDTSDLAVTAQELLDASGAIAAVIPDASLSEYHPEHKHFHIGETMAFGLQKLNGDGRTWDTLTGYEVKKVTFCLIDVNQIQSAGTSDPDQHEIIKSPANANVYNDCFADVQGIQDGWIDRYSHSLPGQEVDITNLAAGTYRLVVEVNPSAWFLESDFSNNTASTGFLLERNQQGQAFLTERPEWSSGIWFAQSPNGMG